MTKIKMVPVVDFRDIPGCSDHEDYLADYFEIGNGTYHRLCLAHRGGMLEAPYEALLAGLSSVGIGMNLEAYAVHYDYVLIHFSW